MTKCANKNKKRRIGRRAFFLSLIVFCAFFIIMIYISFIHVGKWDVVATVNDYDITAGELKEHMSQNKSYVITYFKEKYDADTADGFWNRKYNDTTPNAYLRDYTLEELTRYKVEQQLAISYGLLEQEDTTYKSFLQQLESENDLRAEKVSKGEIIYGVKNYTESTYFSYLYNNMQLKLQDKMSEEGEPLYASDTEIQNWYDEEKEERFTAADTMVLESYSVASGEERMENTDSAAVSGLEELRKDLLAGKSAEEIQKQYQDISYQEITIDDDNAAGMQKTSQIFYEEAQKLKEGEVSLVLYDKNTYLVLRCISREEGGFKDYKEYESGIRKEYVSDKYEEYVDALVKKAKVTKKTKYKRVVIK